MPPGCSSHDSQVPHGVGPPAQFMFETRMRYARSISPPGVKRIAEAPPSGAGASELETRTYPPSCVRKAAWPSEAKCHTYPPTGLPPRAIWRPVKPGGSMRPSELAGWSGPYGPSATAVAANARRRKAQPNESVPPAATAAARNSRRRVAIVM
jgi:hypothetical protein